VGKIRSSEITPRKYWVSRRDFIGTGAVSLTALLLGGCGRAIAPTTPPAEATDYCAGASASQTTDDQGNLLTTCDSVTSYNNFYEYSFGKDGIGELAKDLKVSPWTVTVGGLVNHPQTYDVADIIKKYPPEERIYRFRCVEAWAMVIPWLGFPLADLLKDADPKSEAKYVRFETLYDPEQMPGQKTRSFNWPYIEGLRLDEAMHPLTILATGIYGQPALPQNGAPLRLVVPWKYGFKSIKSIVKIDLVEKMPTSLWMEAGPTEYGFYANVNPDVSHPRWSQASERVIGEISRRDTQLFNGYQADVAHLYEGLDLRRNF
jgi:methionine sulfoxide reductase catalytic subunit